jgi:flavorubredoxin
VTIIFVTNAGNSRQKAAKVFERLHSYIPKLTMVDAAAHNADDMYNKIKAANYILFITSTYGSG